MGEPNNALNVYMKKPNRIRSVLEYYLGEKLPEDWSFEPADGFYAVRNSKGKLSFRQRDVIRRIKAGGYSFWLGLENQDAVNLIFPWRLMEMDSLEYGAGIERIQERNRAENSVYTEDDDFMYAYRKRDRLEPILNLTLYWGRKRWKQPLSLADMLDMSLLPERLRELFADYRVHLIHMRHIPDEALQKMDSDLKYVLGIMKCSESRKRYERYIWENREYFSRIPKSAFDVIDVCTNIKGLKEHMQFRVNKDGEEEADMCKALREIVEEAEKQGVRKGVKQGRQQGRRQGRRQGEEILGQLVGRLLSEGRTEDARLAAVDEAARYKLYREYGILNG